MPSTPCWCFQAWCFRLLRAESLCHLDEHLLVDALGHLLNLAADGQVNLAGAVLDNEASNQGGVNHGLELDVLGASELLELLGNQELLLLLKLDGRAQDRDLRVQERKV